LEGFEFGINSFQEVLRFLGGELENLFSVSQPVYRERIESVKVREKFEILSILVTLCRPRGSFRHCFRTK
jgi:hypothetical protein